MKHLGAALVLSVAALTGLAFAHPFGDPHVEPAKGLDTLLREANMSADAKRVLVTKCADCHSNETRWPIYARVAPGSFLIERDVVNARKQMNLSHWDQLPIDEQAVLASQIIHQAKSGDMPPAQYRFLHSNAALTPADIATLSTIKIANQAVAGSSGPSDASRGKNVFEKRCTGCHALTADREGPRLAGVYGRKAGSMAGFDYSAGLKKSGITWDDTSLEKWLEAPDTLVPDTKMDFHVPSGQERSDLVAYFKGQGLSK